MNGRDEANLANLTGYWKRMGTERFPLATGATACRSVDWPHRLWVDGVLDADPAPLFAATQGDGRATILPFWDNADEKTTPRFADAGFTPLMRQIAMRRPLDIPFPAPSQALRVVPVTTEEQGRVWADIAGRSFGYDIPYPPIARLLGQDDTLLLLGLAEGEPVATGALYAGSGVAGLHQIGTLAEYRRRGLGREMTLHLLTAGVERGLPEATLQASALGAPIYEALGFERRFVITSFIKGAPA